jgi:hypothetical protein
MHNIPINLPDVIQSMELFLEAIGALRLSHLALAPLHKERGDDYFEDVEKRFKYYKMHKPGNYRSERLLTEGWYMDTPQGIEDRKKYAEDLAGKPEPPLSDSETEDDDPDEEKTPNDANQGVLSKKNKKTRKRKGWQKKELYGTKSKPDAIEKDLWKKSRRLAKRAVSRKTLDDEHHVFLTERKPVIYSETKAIEDQENDIGSDAVWDEDSGYDAIWDEDQGYDAELMLD